MTANNLVADLPPNLSNKLLTTLFDAANERIERIVSHGLAFPEGFWYDQDQHEWVVVLKGAAHYPFSGDCPSVCSSRWIPDAPARPTAEQRAALGPIKPYTVADSEGQFLGEGDAAEAIELILQHLPPSCGPAIQGTADDLCSPGTQAD